MPQELMDLRSNKLTHDDSKGNQDCEDEPNQQSCRVADPGELGAGYGTHVCDGERVFKTVVQAVNGVQGREELERTVYWQVTICVRCSSGRWMWD
jgi:hypothetical protein